MSVADQWSAIFLFPHVFSLQDQQDRARQPQHRAQYRQQHDIAPLAAGAVRAPGGKQQGCGHAAERNSHFRHAVSPIIVSFFIALILFID